MIKLSKNHHENDVIMKSININKKERICAECGFKANDIGEFKKHVEHVHTENVDFKCTKCEFHGKTSRQVSEHIQMVHSSDNQLNFTGSNVINRTEFRKHKRKF